MTESFANSTLTAFFDDREDAQEAADRLTALGIPESSVRIVGDDSLTADATASRRDDDKGFWESLGDFFFPDEDRAAYAEGLRRGGTLLTVSSIPASLYEQALDILDDEGTVDIDSRTESWRSEGWTSPGYAGGVSDTSLASTSSFGSTDDAISNRVGLDATLQRGGADTTTLRNDRDEEVIPVIEEQLRVGKRDVNLGRVRVRSYVVEEPINQAVNLREERVFVERRPVDRALSGSEATFTDRVIEAEEHTEEAVVSKETRVKEEIALRREAEERTETISDTVRHTEIEVEDDRTVEEQGRVTKI